MSNETTTDGSQAQEVQTVNSESAGPREVRDAAFENLVETNSNTGAKDNKIDLLLDLNLVVSVELGKTNMMIKDILELGRGSIIEFDKLVSEPVDILINGRRMAEGEVVVVDKHFGIRITSMIDASERLKGLKK